MARKCKQSEDIANQKQKNLTKSENIHDNGCVCCSNMHYGGLCIAVQLKSGGNTEKTPKARNPQLFGN